MKLEVGVVLVLCWRGFGLTSFGLAWLGLVRFVVLCGGLVWVLWFAIIVDLAWCGVLRVVCLAVNWYGLAATRP